MKSFKTMLPALGLVLGATMALAMNVPTMVSDKDDPRLWTPDPSQIETNGYREITGEVIDVDYECDESTQMCEVEFVNDNPFGPIAAFEEGTYVAL